MLAQSLRQAESVPKALAAYEAARKPRVTRVQKRAAANGRIYHMSARYARMAAQRGLGALSYAPGNMLLRQFDWLYGAKPGLITDQ